MTHLIIISENGESSPAQLTLEFRVFLVSAQTGKHTPESRTLRFWFRDHPEVKDMEPATIAQDFFKELVSPQEFPRGCNLIRNLLKVYQML